jgi:1-acyl-sn-glycerol-3-phosphate acyltransferase
MFAAGALATVAVAMLVRCRGPARADSDSTDRMVRWWAGVWLRAARDLAAGHSLLAYPEGKISPDGAIGTFKDGAFIIAVASQVPVAIHGTRLIWPPGRSAIHRGQVRVAAASPLLTTGLTQHDVAGLGEQARDAICSAHHLVTAMKGG